MELFMSLLQGFAAVLFVVCLVGFIGVYMVFLFNLAKEVGVKLSLLLTKIVGA